MRDDGPEESHGARVLDCGERPGGFELTCGDASARFDEVGPNYFTTVGIPIILGRDIGPQDVAAGESVCVVNEAFAKFYFHGANPLGRHVTDEFPDTRKTFVIVGVARDARDHNLRRDVFRRFYLSALQPLGEYSPFMNYEVRTFGDPSLVVEAARRHDSEAAAAAIAEDVRRAATRLATLIPAGEADQGALRLPRRRRKSEWLARPKSPPAVE